MRSILRFVKEEEEEEQQQQQQQDDKDVEARHIVLALKNNFPESTFLSPGLRYTTSLYILNRFIPGSEITSMYCIVFDTLCHNFYQTFFVKMLDLIVKLR